MCCHNIIAQAWAARRKVVEHVQPLKQLGEAWWRVNLDMHAQRHQRTTTKVKIINDHHRFKANEAGGRQAFAIAQS
jgi:hypothetical protein